MEYFLDDGEIKRWEETPEGYLMLWASVAVANHDMIYRDDADGKEIVRYIDSVNLFNKKSLNTAIAKPFTLNHPPRAIEANSYRDHAVGTSLQEWNNDEDRLVIASLIHNPDVIEKIKNKEITHVSAGYGADCIKDANGKFLQTNRHYNHFALLTKDFSPRAGTNARILYDSTDEQSTSRPNVDGDNRANRDSNSDRGKSSISNFSHLEDSKMDEKILRQCFSDSIKPLETSLNALIEALKPKEEPDVKVTTDGETLPTQNVSECVRLHSVYDSVLKQNNKTIDYKQSEPELKKAVMSCIWKDLTFDSLSEGEINGLWMAFEKQYKETQIELEEQQFQQDSYFSNQPQVDPKQAFINAISPQLNSKK